MSFNQFYISHPISYSPKNLLKRVFEGGWFTSLILQITERMTQVTR